MLGGLTRCEVCPVHPEEIHGGHVGRGSCHELLELTFPRKMTKSQLLSGRA